MDYGQAQFIKKHPLNVRDSGCAVGSRLIA